jgi:polygalacturonase
MRKETVCCIAGLLLSSPVLAAVNPLPPNINTNNVFLVTSFGAVGDGTTDCTAAISSAISAAAGASGGGTVELPAPGIYLSGPLVMQSKVNFQIDPGATLRLLPFGTYSPQQTSFLSASGLADLELSGGGGIDGQGSNWWVNAQNASPYLVDWEGCNRILIQNITISNAPAQNIVFKGSGSGNILVQGVNIFAPSSHVSVSPSHNTDGIDLVGTNGLVQNCVISTGDDNIAVGSSSGVSANLLVTNCLFGVGHGMTIGSNTRGGVSNLTVINCTFTNTDYGIKMKSDNLSSGGSGEGGVAQNLSYFNLGMTNLRYATLLINSYYKDPTYGSAEPTGITPAIAASRPVPAPSSSTPIWRNIAISNVTATVANGNGSQAGMIWGRTEMPVTNITLTKVSINATGTFNLFNVKGLQIADSPVKVTVGKTYTLFNAQFAVTNSTNGATSVTLDGLASTNSLELDRAPASVGDATIFGANPISLNGSLLTNTTSLSLGSTNVINFGLGSNAARVTVTGNLNLTNTLNISDVGGFGPGVYTLFTYTGSFAGNPTLGTTPAGFTYNLTNGAGKVNLVVTGTCVNPTANVSGGGSICSGGSVGIQAALTGTQPWTVTWSDGFVQSGVSASLATRNVSPSVTSNYTVTALSDATGCPAGTLSGNALVTVNARPTASVSGGGTICSGASSGIQAALTGAQPWTVTWSDGFVQSGVTASPASRNVSPLVTSNYTVTALSDATGCSAGTLSGNALVTVNAHPTAGVSGGGTICSGDSSGIQAALTGTQPWTVTWSDGFVQSGVTASPASRNVSPLVTSNYTVTELSDATGCSAGTLSGNALVTVNAHPTATVSGGGAICSSNSIDIQAALTGKQPWTVTWSDGFVQSGVTNSPATRSLSPVISSNYTVTALSDATGCSAGTLSGNASVTVNARPTASVSGGGTVCGGNLVTIQAVLTGTQPWTVTWSDGFVQSGITNSPATRDVSPPVSTNYTVTGLSDINGCSAGSLSGNAAVTVCVPEPFSISSVQFANPDQVVLTWDSVDGNVYQVLSQDDLTLAVWVTNATVTASGTSASWTNSGVSGVTQRFYRVVNIP